LLGTFIGSQVAELSDGTHRARLSTGAQVLDVLSVVFSLGIAFGTGWYVWGMTEKRIRHMEGLPAETEGPAADALGGASIPLLRNFSSTSLQSSGDPEEVDTTKDNIDEQV